MIDQKTESQKPESCCGSSMQEMMKNTMCGKKGSCRPGAETVTEMMSMCCCPIEKKETVNKDEQ